jgi:hypothetical protein
MCEMQLVIKDVALMPPWYFDAVEGAREVVENALDLAKRVIDLLDENVHV